MEAIQFKHAKVATYLHHFIEEHGPYVVKDDDDVEDSDTECEELTRINGSKNSRSSPLRLLLTFASFNCRLRARLERAARS